MHAPRNNLHLHRVLFCSAVDLLQVIVIAVLRQPTNDVSIRPVDLQRPGVFVENVVLLTNQQGSLSLPH